MNEEPKPYTAEDFFAQLRDVTELRSKNEHCLSEIERLARECGRLAVENAHLREGKS